MIYLFCFGLGISKTLVFPSEEVNLHFSLSIFLNLVVSRLHCEPEHCGKILKTSTLKETFCSHKNLLLTLITSTWNHSQQHFYSETVLTTGILHFFSFLPLSLLPSFTQSEKVSVGVQASEASCENWPHLSWSAQLQGFPRVAVTRTCSAHPDFLTLSHRTPTSCSDFTFGAGLFQTS